MVEKKNPNYEGSAVNLCNPIQVGDLLHRKKEKQAEMERLQAILTAYPEYENLQKLGKEITELDIQIHLAIDSFGSYQNVNIGDYAVKQRRESITYKPELVRCYAPSEVVYAVLIESIDSKKMDDQVKLGRLTPEQARQCGDVKETFAYIIK